MEKIGAILKKNQPTEYKRLNAKKRKKRRKPKKEHLSFSDIERMMKNNPGIDESRCR